MLRVIMEKELRDILSSTKFAVTFAVCAVLIILAFVAAAHSYHLENARYLAARQENLRQLEGVTDWLSVQQVRVFLPPSPLAALVSGVANDIGRTTEVHGRGELVATGSRYGEEPVFAMFRFLDLEFIFQIVLSLFAILFAYDAINGEKERGTLRLALANPVPRDLFIVGKLTGSFLALVVPLLIPLLIGCGLLAWLGVPMTADDWWRLALVIAAGMLYCGAFLSISVAVSALTSRSSSAFLFLLLTWILAVLIIPRGAVLVAGRAVPTPSVDEIAAQKARYSGQLWREDRDALASYHPAAQGGPDQMMREFQQYMQKRADERDKKMRELSLRLEEERANRQSVQERYALGLARVSPAASFLLAADALAGTSLRLKDEYRRAALAYQTEFGKFMLAKTGMNPGGAMVVFRMNTGDEARPAPINPAELPAFQYVRPGIAEIFPSVLLDFTLLLCFNAVFFVIAFVAFLRYDVR